VLVGTDGLRLPAKQFTEPYLHRLLIRTPPAALEPRFDLAEADLVGGRGLYVHGQRGRGAGSAQNEVNQGSSAFTYFGRYCYTCLLTLTWAWGS
jgi:hypothetical protein